ncbi:MAG: hypothetical protein QMD92_08475, partial [bacterium]|nr:hypothetical protein [bacterium]
MKRIIIILIIMLTFYSNLYALEYKLVKKWGGYGSEEEKFDGIVDIGIDSYNCIYVVEENSCRIQKFTNSGKFIKKWGNKGFEDGHFCFPSSITIDDYGNVYIVDTYSPEGWGIPINSLPRIQKFTTEGKFLSKFYAIKNKASHNKTRNEDNKYNYKYLNYVWHYISPSCLDIDNYGNLYIISQIIWTPFSPDLFRVANNGEYIDNLCDDYLYNLFWDGSKGPYHVHSIVVDRKKNIYYVHGRSSSNKFSEKFTFIKSFDLKNNLVKEWSTQDSINDIAIDKEGNIYAVSDGEKFLFRKYDNSGRLLVQYSCKDFNIEPLKQVESIAVDKNGNIFIADYGDHYIYKFALAKNTSIEDTSSLLPEKLAYIYPNPAKEKANNA